MTMSRTDSQQSPLTVKEQFEASASRFWSTVRNNMEDAKCDRKGPSTGKPEDETGNEDSIEEGTSPTASAAMSFQSVIHAVFGSCTNGGTYEGYNSRSAKQPTRCSSPDESTATPSSSSSRGGGSSDEDEQTSRPKSSPLGTTNQSSKTEEDHRGNYHSLQTASAPQVQPQQQQKPSKRKFFPNNHDRAEKAVLHLREQQLQQQQDLQLQHRQKDYERVVSNRVATKQSQPSPVNDVKKEQQHQQQPHHSFFPVSTPVTGRDPPGNHQGLSSSKPKTSTGFCVPKEVPSGPPRRMQKGGMPLVAHAHDDLFDFDDDGVSAITQETVDRMMRERYQQQQQQQKGGVPNELVLKTVYSDITDPISRPFGQWKDGDPKATIVQFPLATSEVHVSRESMSPPRLSRESRSSGTRSFMTTNSTQTDDFNAWKREEQQYWESLVAKEESTTFTKSPKVNTNNSNSMNTVFRSDSITRGGGYGIPPNPGSMKMHRVREKVQQNYAKLNQAEQMMDTMLRESGVEMAEI